jgi:hypothetical protein
MEDDDTRKLILRLQMEDLASIWASSTTSNDDATEFDADVSLRLYRQELRTAEQQIEDEHSAQAAAQDEHRQRDAVVADREVARRLFLELNPNEPLPEFVGNDQLAIIESSTSDNALLKFTASPTSEASHLSEQPVVPSSSSPCSQRTSLLLTNSKRLADHLDSSEEPPLKKQATENTTLAANLDGSAQAPTLPVSTSAGRKRPAQDDGIAPPAKRQEILPINSALVSGTTQSAAKQQSTSAVSDQAVFGTPTFNQFVLDNFGKSSVIATEAPQSSQRASPRRDSTLRPSFPPRANGRDNRTASTTDPEDPEPQKLPASRQPVALGQQSVIEQDQSSTVECIACCREGPRGKSYSNACSHTYCSKCINRLFRKANRDDSLWPPQCCKAEMPIEDIEHLLRDDLVPLVKARQAEMSVPILERTYCVACSAYVPQDTIHGNSALCHKCWTSTCSNCKEKAHVGDCQNKLEQEIKDLEALAEKEGWKKCSTCMMIVEHNTGCNHMT